MAFNVRKGSLNHSPAWYHDRGLDEDSAPSMVAFINADIRTVDLDDPTLTPPEKLSIYEEEWEKILKGKEGNVSAADIQEVLEREGAFGERPVDLYSKPPFTTIRRIMKREGLSTTDVGAFLRWKAKADNVKTARVAKAKKLKKTKTVDPAATFRSFLESKKRKQPTGEL